MLKTILTWATHRHDLLCYAEPKEKRGLNLFVAHKA